MAYAKRTISVSWERQELHDAPTFVVELDVDGYKIMCQQLSEAGYPFDERLSTGGGEFTLLVPCAVRLKTRGNPPIS